MMAAAAVAVLGLAGAAQTARIRIKVKGRLAATDVDPDARGRARLLVRDADGRFDLIARHLAARSDFDVIVRRVKVATLSTASDGHGRVRFRSRPRGRDLLLGFDPRGAHIVVRDGDGEDVLDGIMPDEPFAPGEVACCLPDPEEIEDDVECEGRTEAACASVGGIALPGPRSCLPNPCEGVEPSDTTTVCCLPESSRGAFVDPDGDGDVECQDVAAPVCLAAGGTVVDGEGCELDPCEPTPPHAEVACCVAAACEVLTPESCGARGGSVVPDASCDEDPCAEE